MLSESINEKCRRLTLEDEYRKIISDPYIQEYLEYKNALDRITWIGSKRLTTVRLISEIWIRRKKL